MGVGFLRPVTTQCHHIENDGVMNDSVNGRNRRHRVFEDPIPGRKSQVGGNNHTAPLIALGQECK